MSTAKKATKKVAKQKQAKKTAPALGSIQKRALVSAMILKVLGARVVRWGDLADQVSARLPKFPGSVPHYVVLCLRDLQRLGKVKRAAGPIALYSKTATKRRN